jgi:hypothetical protein
LPVFLVVPTQAHSEENLEQLELLLGDVSLNKLPFVLALDEGIYVKNGLQVRPLFTHGSVEIIRKSGVDVPEEFILKGDRHIREDRRRLADQRAPDDGCRWLGSGHSRFDPHNFTLAHHQSAGHRRRAGPERASVSATPASAP